MDFKEVDIKNGENFEVLIAAGTVPGQRRKLVVIGCYLPPNYNKARGKATLDFIMDLTLEMKRKYHDPQLIVAGDYKQWKIAEALQDFADIKEVPVGNTRDDRSIDRIFLNVSRSVVDSGTLETLETEDEESRSSNHRIAYCRMDLIRRWETYTYRHFTDRARKNFKEWMVLHDWREVYAASGSDNKTNAYQNTLTAAMDRYFLLKTNRKKSSDLPWINMGVLRKIKARKRLFWAEGGKRTEAWKEEKRKTGQLVRDIKRGYIDTQKGHILADDANRNFFRHVKTFSRLEKHRQFDVRELYKVDTTDKEIAEDLSEYFVKVLREFDPLRPGETLMTREKGLPLLQNFEVASRIRRFHKPKSMVPGDIFPKIVTELSDFFALPLTNIYNEITRTGMWPACWKKEFVTVIPKVPCHEALSDLRNISCTMLSSKIYESYVLD